MVEHLICTQGAAGSSPAVGSINKKMTVKEQVLNRQKQGFVNDEIGAIYLLMLDIASDMESIKQELNPNKNENQTRISETEKNKH